MKLHLKLTCTMLVSILLCGLTVGNANQVRTASVKKKNGQVIKGEIKGLVVLGEVGQVNKDSASGWGAIYFRVKGEDIEAIDEEGVHVRVDSNVSMTVISQKGKPDDVAVLEMSAAFVDDQKFMAMAEYSSKNSGASVNVDWRKDKTPIGAKLIGEFRREGTNGKLISAIEIATGKNVVTIPVEEIVEFKKAAEKPK